MPEPWTTTKLLSWCADYFKSSGFGSARLDAELLLAHVLNLTRMQLYLNFDKPVFDADLASFKELVKRRVRHEPVAYILGKKEFWSQEFFVRPGVLIPRPDTEVLIEAVLERLRLPLPAEGEGMVLHGFEVGTGSGAIAITLLAELPQLKMMAVEISEMAVRVTLENARKHGVENRLQVLHEDLFSYANRVIRSTQPPTNFDFIVSNPPYLSEKEFSELPPGIKDFEPREALLGGVNGLIFHSALADFARGQLVPEGFLAVEISETQGTVVPEIFRSAGFKNVILKKDYAGLDRVVVGSAQAAIVQPDPALMAG